jgi:hypothetical protein
MANLLTASIANTVRPIKGLKPKAWIFNRADGHTLTFTNNLITNLVKGAGKTSFKIEGFKDFMNAGSSAVVAENFPTAYKHSFAVDTFSATAAERANIDLADDVFVVVEVNGSKTEGCFLAYGVNNGLWKSSQAQMANDNNAVTKVVFDSRTGMEETYSVYPLWLTNYATTLALLTTSES